MSRSYEYNPAYKSPNLKYRLNEIPVGGSRSYPAPEKADIVRIGVALNKFSTRYGGKFRQKKTGSGEEAVITVTRLE